MGIQNFDRTKVDPHKLVTAKYDIIYKNMAVHWDFAKDIQSLSVKDKLDFVCFSWGEICRRNIDPKVNLDSWKKSLKTFTKVSKFQVNESVETEAFKFSVL